jgi:hypothetical protein
MDDATQDNRVLFDAVASLNHFNDMPYPRQRGKVTYPPDEVLLLARLAVLAGAEAFVEIAVLVRRNSIFCVGSGRFTMERRPTTVSSAHSDEVGH